MVRITLVYENVCNIFVHYFIFCLLASVEKARKAAENDNYTSTDDQCMGKGQRKKKSNPFIHSDADEDEEKNNDGKNCRSSRKNKLKVYGRKKVNVSINEEQSEDNFMENEQNINKALPAWPVEIQSSQNNANIVNSVTNNNQTDDKFQIFLILKSTHLFINLDFSYAERKRERENWM